MKKSALFVMALMTPSLLFAQQATNSIYIDQVGDGSTITLTQQGQTNGIGKENNRFQLQGSNQTVTMTQRGNGNMIEGNIIQADNINYDITTLGDSNSIVFDHGSSGSVAGTTLNLTATGSMNTFDLKQGTTSSSTGATQTINVTGDSNQYVSTINTDDVIQTATVAGDSNQLTIVQNGHASKNMDINLVGSGNIFDIKQTSTLNVDRLSINSQSVGSTVHINQCTSGC
jgi:hypothetical protein